MNTKNPQIFMPLNCAFLSPAKSRSRNTNPRNRAAFCLTISEPPLLQTLSVFQKVQALDLEFKSLSEPIDRVKRLLHYANLLPQFDESAKILENRVMGCTAQVWLEVKMDNNGVMKFRVDSDSEITKGFCSCLIWVLDGAKFEEILTVQTDDLIEMNVGLPSRGHSRVNTWHNVLISMQKRTKDLVEERNGQTIPSLIHDITVNGSYKETQNHNAVM
ncbi:SufE-like protein 2 [Forsythia ovata]|uniref:SufE-like protein 2 n=1 Tax=Forsythia ovata TaxID=205694 RepID=A0ABD1WF92_9LAMI